MYLSRLLIDVGSDPDRPRPGRLWLRNVYHVHQRLCMAFPSDDRKKQDASFLKRFRTEDFPPYGKAHGSARTDDDGFLFRMDPIAGGSPIITVQSAVKPDWDYAFHNAMFLLAGKPEATQFDPFFEVGEKLRFRLKANPTRRICANSKDAKGNPVDQKWKGKRVPVLADSLEDWITERLKKAGTELTSLSLVEKGYLYFSKNGNGASQRLFSVLFEGTATVRIPEELAQAVRSGIGREKAFGFGLLSLAPVKL